MGASESKRCKCGDGKLFQRRGQWKGAGRNLSVLALEVVDKASSARSWGPSLRSDVRMHQFSAGFRWHGSLDAAPSAGINSEVDPEASQ